MVLAATEWSDFVPLCALFFTVASFWWIYLRRGRLRASEPSTFVSVDHGPTLRIRFPIVIFNTGAAGIVVDDLRVLIEGHELDWRKSFQSLQPIEDQPFTLAAPYVIPGRQASQVLAEFGADRLAWHPTPDTAHALRIERKEGARWKPLLAFDWWAPGENVGGYYTGHRNVQGG